MALTLTHPFVSAIADGPDATVVRPSNWNAAHALAGAGVGDLLVASGATTLGAIAAVALSQVLISQGVGVVPVWSGTPALAGVTFTGGTSLTGGTGTLTLAGGDLLISSFLVQGNLVHAGAGGILKTVAAIQFDGTNLKLYGTNPAIYFGSGNEVSIGQEAANIAQQGDDAASPAAQIYKGPDARAGTDTNTVGGAMKNAGGRPTGTGLPGIVGLQGSLLSTTTGTAASALVDRFIANAAKVLTNNSAIAVVNATITNGSNVGGLLTYTIEMTDGTDFQVETGQAVYSALNKAGTVTATITKVNSQQNLGAGTLATTWAISAANPAVISINANSSLTPSTGFPRITFSVQNLGQQAVAIQ